MAYVRALVVMDLEVSGVMQLLWDFDGWLAREVVLFSVFVGALSTTGY